MIQEAGDRGRSIIRYSFLGIGMNLFLAVFKIAAGTAAHAHAVMLDGVNSLSDMISSLISILSMHFAGKRGDSDHPLGYGRIEYMSSFIVTMIVMYIGVTTIIDSVRSLIHPHEAPAYTPVVIAVMTVSLICKILYGVLMRSRGRDLNSVAMIMSGTDSLGDALISVAILAAIVIYKATGIDIEHYLCIFISLMIIRTGIGMTKECISKLLGTRLDDDERRRIIGIVAGFDEVLNVSNLIMHNYGEGYYVGSVDIEVEESLTAAEISRLSRRIIRRAEECGVNITSVGISGTNVEDPDAMFIWDAIVKKALRYKSIKRVNSFTIDREENSISFYVVPDYSRKDREEELCLFKRELEETYPEMDIEIHTAIDM